MWAFEAYAEGLVTAAAVEPEAAEKPPRQLHKTSRNNDIFDVDGKPLAASKRHEATTWRTHHSFSGRCALVKPAAYDGWSGEANGAAPTCPPYPSGPSWAEQAWAAYQSWSVTFSLHSATADEPHILLSVAPAYFPLLSSPTGETLTPDAKTLASLPAAPSAQEQKHYNNRLLDTPLIWEEAYALSVECTPRGLFLWSDHWELYGKKILDRCLEVQKGAPRPAGDAVVDFSVNQPLRSYSGAVRLRFNAADVERGAEEGADSHPAVLAVDIQTPASQVSLAASTTKGAEEVQWQHVVDVPLPMDALARKAAFRPHVTLLESGDSVAII
ncbi:hypothetical protein NQL31_005723 [Lotmaria passim]